MTLAPRRRYCEPPDPSPYADGGWELSNDYVVTIPRDPGPRSRAMWTRCVVCRLPVDPAALVGGYTAHPNCDPVAGQ